MDEILLTAQELADYLGYDVKSVYNFKYNGRGPKRTHVGRNVRFKKSDVDAWIAGQNGADDSVTEEEQAS